MNKFLIFLDKENHIINMDKVLHIKLETVHDSKPLYCIIITFEGYIEILRYEDKEMFNFDLRNLEDYCERN